MHIAIYSYIRNGVTLSRYKSGIATPLQLKKAKGLVTSPVTLLVLKMYFH